MMKRGIAIQVVFHANTKVKDIVMSCVSFINAEDDEIKSGDPDPGG